MPVQILSLIDQFKTLLSHLAEHIEELEDCQKRERIKMLLHYAVGHENRLKEQLQLLEKSESKTVLNDWLAFHIPKFEVDLEFDLDKKYEIPEIVERVLKVDEALIDRYQTIINMTDREKVRDVFVQLLEEAKSERNRFVRDAFMMDF